MMRAFPFALAFAVLSANAACTRATTADEAALATAIEACLDGGSREMSVPARVAIDDVGEVLLIEIAGERGGVQDDLAEMAVLDAIRACEPYDIAVPGDYDVVLRY